MKYLKHESASADKIISITGNIIFRCTLLSGLEKIQICRARLDNFSSFVTFGHVRPAMKAGEFLASCLMAHNSWLSKAMQVLSPQKECAVRCCPYRWWIELELALYIKAIMRHRDLKMQLI